MNDSETETPWAMVLRMKAEGGTLESIVEALRARGLAQDDIELLLKDEPGFSTSSRARAAPDKPAAPAEPERPAFSTGPGSGLRWFLITCAAALAFAGAAFWSSGSGAGAIALALALVGLIALLVPEFRSGVRRTVKKLGFVQFFVCIVPALAGFIGGWQPWTIAGAAAFFASVPMLIWASTTGARLPRVTDYSGGDAFEDNGVQFTVRAPERVTLPLGAAFDVEIHAQNCVDAPRDLVVEIGGETAVVSSALRQEFALQPGYVQKIVVPVRVRALSSSWSTLIIGIGGKGSATGARLRLDRGHDYVSPGQALAENALGVATLAVAGAGVFRLGSNGAVRVQVDGDLPPVHEERAPVVATVYEPRRADVERAARS